MVGRVVIQIGEVEARAQREIARLVSQHAAEVETMEGCARDMAKLADRWKQCANEAETQLEEEMAREREERRREIAELQVRLASLSVVERRSASLIAARLPTVLSLSSTQPCRERGRGLVNSRAVTVYTCTLR